MLEISVIRKKLQDRNLSAVAKRINVTRAYLSNIRNGRVEPSKHMQTLLSMYLESEK
jgi:transcriptional regulator with XRE-family HTH domain